LAIVRGYWLYGFLLLRCGIIYINGGENKMAYPNSRGCELENRVEQLDEELEIAEKRITRLIAQVAKLEKRLNLFNQQRTISWRNQGDI
jgi:hypothetical protein